MAIKVGNSWVSQEAYTYAKAKAELDTEQKNGGKGSSVLADLAKQYPDMKFTMNTAPFSSDGTNNIAVAPNVLRKMQEDPEARIEYEALIYDCVQTMKNEPLQHGAFTTVARGVIINEDGSCGGWTVTQCGDGKKKKSQTKINTEKYQERLEKIKKKKAEERKERKKEQAEKPEKQREDDGLAVVYEKHDKAALEEAYSLSTYSKKFPAGYK